MDFAMKKCHITELSREGRAALAAEAGRVAVEKSRAMDLPICEPRLWLGFFLFRVSESYEYGKLK